VRNAVANILDRYTLAQIVEVTLSKLKRDGIEAPFLHKDKTASPTHPIEALLQ
jgi:hypothetical protein